MDARSCCSAHEPSAASAAARRAESFARAHATRIVADLAALIRHPSVSADARHAGDVHRCAAWLARHLERIGLEHARVLQTPGPPVVCGDWLHAPGRPTLLVYGHYDVQPADPLDEWSTPPFEPAIREGRLFGRGAADDKGQFFAHLAAAESWLRTSGTLPVNVKCLIEGEEEIGSPHLPAFLAAHPWEAAADVAVVSDMRILGPGRPALVESLRGMLSLELSARGLATDLHSGNFGGAVQNPLQVLCGMLARLHDRSGRVAIPGFYDRVRDLPSRERSEMSAAGPSDGEILAEAGTDVAWGERGYSAYERTTIRPALTITAVRGGHPGPGVKAVIPARATATLDVRLAADQDPEEIDRLCRRFLSRIAPSSIALEVKTLSGAKPVSTRRDSPGARAAIAAYAAGFGRAPVPLKIGGTVPVVHLLERTLGIPAVMMGFALPDSNLHAPDENMHLPTFFRGIRTSVHFLSELAREAAGPPDCPIERRGAP